MCIYAKFKRCFRWAGLTFIFPAAMLMLGAGCRRDPDGVVFPGRTWSQRPPVAVGYDADRLYELSEAVGGHGCVVVDGHMIHTWGRFDWTQDIASAAKPLYTHFTLHAIEEGRMESLDTPVVDFVPELAELNENLGFKDRTMTFRHLLEQTSGYGLEEPPGAAFGYNDFQTGLLVWTLLRHVYACGYIQADRELLIRRLGSRIGFEDGPTMQHRHSRPGRIRISARDLARFGWLYLNEGRWGRRTILPPELVRLALGSPLPPDFPRTSGQPAERMSGVVSIGGEMDQKGHAGALSFFWWLNRPGPDGELLLPDATPGTFLAMGHGGHFVLLVVPEYRLVAVWLDGLEDEELSPFDEVGRHRVNGIVRDLLRTCVQGSTNTSGQQSLPE